MCFEEKMKRHTRKRERKEREKRREDDMGVQKRGDGWMGGWME